MSGVARAFFVVERVTAFSVASSWAALVKSCTSSSSPPRVEPRGAVGWPTAMRSGTRGWRALLATNGVRPVDACSVLLSANSARGRKELQLANDVA
ncbi:hypothetical protein PF005_g33473 [Phytophthora fragariae]|uniref:Uncharacterized protein n=1 Tax=Phytophthora fragariae TaxID=53985 RepID=A0A6A3PG22_9STRA|nr:hypothetical protein PF003_g22479 [Phytophthora fragariae]KAE9053070.1 hypothetical protein PF010_g33060 [Phytophthora fragariae]KAE9054055.1 hypothetical protein PF006_g33362 [Phytophthora fragariae]KAE9056447.1 hypothetical protein PF007_g31988 [Phytophthora fragariae]KAE9152070.1 hypothetical protein PF005_g33473 [Phytophthora fragariae]